MSYVRVTMVDLKTPENLNAVINELNQADMIFPEIQMMLTIATTETTGLAIAVYKDEASANKGAKQRAEYFKKLNAEMEVSFEGPLASYYYKDIVKPVGITTHYA